MTGMVKNMSKRCKHCDDFASKAQLFCGWCGKPTHEKMKEFINKSKTAQKLYSRYMVSRVVSIIGLLICFPVSVFVFCLGLDTPAFDVALIAGYLLSAVCVYNWVWSERELTSLFFGIIFMDDEAVNVEANEAVAA